MSTTIDQRVVEMRFDNKQFERETKQSMSTLDKLKKKLNLTGASKGLEEINKASKNNSLPVLGSAAEAVSAKFSALQVVGITALANITNSAINAGKRIVESLTIAPIKDGFQEYEMTLNAVQTTMAATGKTAAEVEKELKKLDEYADKTVYSTADMLNNLPKFTNAGVELEKATEAMIGIANATALAGGDASKASIAFYNLGQAIGTGYLTRMDYNSINNAGIATMEWKNRMVEAAIAQGTLTKVGEDAYEAGGKTYTLQQLFIDGLQKQWATTEVMMKVFGDYGDETTEIGKKSYAAAQDIKTFSMMMDSLKATAGTGWKETWELIFGGLEPAKKFWTGVSNFLSNIITGMADWRNNLIEKVMGGNPISEAFQKIIGNLNKGTILSGSIEKVTDALYDLDEVATKVIRGDFGNAPVRYEKLSKAGYNYALVQNRVNEMLGSSFRHNVELAESEKSLNRSQKSANKTRGETIEQLVAMSDAELKSIGLRQVDINALRALEEQSKKTGIPIKELADDLSLLNGRTLLINSFKNIGDALVGTFTALKDAWKSIFPGDGSEMLYNIIAGFHKLTTYLEVNDETAAKLTRTFKGVFALLDIVLTLTAGPLKIAFKALTGLLGAFDLDILDATAMIGDAIVKFRDWIDATIDFNKIFDKFLPYIKSIGSAIGDWVSSHVDISKWIERIKDAFSGAGTFIERWMEGLKNAKDLPVYLGQMFASGLIKLKDFVIEKIKNLGTSMMETMTEISLKGFWSTVPGDIMAGFEKGLLWGIASVIKKIKTFCEKFITTVKDVFIIHSPSQVMFEIGQFIIQGLINGVSSMYNLMVSAIKNIFTKTQDSITAGIDFGKPFGIILGVIKTFGEKVVTLFKGLHLDKIAAGALGIGMLILAKKTIDLLSMFANPFDALGDMFRGIGNAFEALGKNLKAGAMKKRAQALLIISAAIVVLVMAILPLTELSWEQLGKAGLSLLALAVVIAALYFVLGVIGDKGGSDLKSTSKLIVMAGSIFLVAYAVQSLAKVALEPNIKDTMLLLAEIVAGMAALMIVFGKVISADKASNIDKAGTMLVKMAAALLTITTVIKIVSGFTYTDIQKGMTFILGVGALFTLVVAVSKIAGTNADKAGAMMLKMSIAMLLLAGVVKIASGFSGEELAKGAAFVIGAGVICGILIKIAKRTGKNADKAGAMLVGVAAAMLIMTQAVKMAAGMSLEDIGKGLLVIGALGVLVAGLIKVAKYSKKGIWQVGVMLLGISAALLIMVGITWIVSKLDQKEMWKAVGFVAALEAMFAGLIAVTKFSKSTEHLNKTLILFLVAIGMLIAAVVGLSFIDKKDLAAATASIMGVMGMFAVMMLTTKYTKNTKHIHKSLLVMLGIVTVLTALIIAMSNLTDPKAAIASAASLSVLLLAFSSSIKILNKVSRINKTALSALVPMVEVAFALGLFLAVMAGLTKGNESSLIASSISLGILLNTFTASIKILDGVSLNKTVVENLTVMIGVATALGTILVVMAALTKHNIPSLIASSVALGLLLNAFALSIKILHKVSINKTAIDAIQSMITVVIGLGVVLTLMALAIPAEQIPSLIASSVALGVLLNAFSASILILSKADWFRISTQNLATMAIITVALAGVLAGMSFLPQANIPSLIASSIALGILLNAFALSMKILSQTGYIRASLTNLATMAIIAVALGGVLAGMSFLPQANIPSLIASSVALGILLNAFALSIGLLSAAGHISTTAMVAMAPMILVTAGLATILTIMAKNMPSSQVAAIIPTAISLGILLNALAIAVGILSIVGVAAANAIPAVAAMGVVIGELALIVAAIGALAYIPGIEALLSDGGNILHLIGNAIGQFVSGIVVGFASNVIGLLPEIGNALSEFMVGLTPFIDKVSTLDMSLLEGMGILASSMLLLVGAELLAGIASLGGVGLLTAGLMLYGFIEAAKPFFDYIAGLDSSTVESAKMLAEMILILTAADLLSGITSMFNGSVNFADLGTQLTEFGKAVKGFSDEVTGIDTKSVEAAAAAGEMIAGLQSKLEGVGGLKQAILGEKDLGSFATQLTDFGRAIVGFNNVVVQNGGIDDGAVESAVKAGEAIAGLQSALYGVGGLKQDFLGEKDLRLFSLQLVTFGQAIVGFSNIVKTSPIDETSVSSAVNAGKLIAGLQNEIEASGGFMQDLFGEKSLAGFGNQIKIFGEAIVAFSDTVTGNINEDAVTAASNAGRVMAQVQDAIPEDKWFDGKVSIEDFGAKIVKFGEHIANYSDKVKDINVETVNKSLSAAETLVSIAKSVIDLDLSGIETFKSLKSIGTTISEYYTSISGVDFESLSNASISVRNLVSMIRNMVDLDTSGVTSFQTAITTLASTDMAGFVNAFKDTTKFSDIGLSIVNSIRDGMFYNGFVLTLSASTMMDNIIYGILSRNISIMTTMNAIINNVVMMVTSRKEMFNSLGVLLMSRFISGIASRSGAVRSTVSSCVIAAAISIRSHYGDFYNAGSYLVDGFASGISANSFKAAAAASAMAKAAADAAEQALAINSPSKVFRAIGYSVPEGFALGIDRLSYMAKSSAVSMADIAVDSVKNSISRIAEAVHTDIDSQPTIRPVLDLSNIESGASAVNKLFNTDATVGVMANAGTINTMMNNRNQNGGNSDLISAIDKLRGDLNNVGNTYYSIDGITYSNGTEVADAITSLTRAIKMEGRV